MNRVVGGWMCLDAWMPLTAAIARFNKKVTNPVLGHLVGYGPFAQVEHVGRTSGRTYRTVIMAFRQKSSSSQGLGDSNDGDSGAGAGDLGTVTMALTYGPDVDWLKNATAAGHARLRFQGRILTLGAPRRLATDEGLARMPLGPRQILPLTGTSEFVQFPVLAESPSLASR